MSDIILHPGQSEVFNDLFVEENNRYAAVCASRGFGKTHLAGVSAIQAVSELMQLDASIPNKNVTIVAPTYSQCVDIYHPLIAYQLGAESMAVKHSKDAGRFWFPRNVELRLWSYESADRMRGTGQYFVVLDEVSSWHKSPGAKETWQSIIQPCIATRWSEQRAKEVGSPHPGRALAISTPEGYNFFYEMYNYAESDSNWKSYHYDYTNSPYLDPDEIERIKHQIDPIKFAREYLARFEDSGNSVFYCFDRKLHVKNDLEYFDKDETVHVAIDFNVGIMASCIFAVRGNQLHFIDEMQGHPDTDTLAKTLRNKYKEHKIVAYPDPSGRARKTSAVTGSTDFSILQSYGIQTLARTKAPPIVDSVNAVNRKLKSAAGDVDMYVSNKCTNTIASLERTTWVDNNSDSASIDKSQGIEHWSDGIRYAVEYLFPVQAGVKRTQRGFMF
jgi:hypothetical protein